MRIKAVTLLELIVALAIGSILLGSILFAYQWVVEAYVKTQELKAQDLGFETSFNAVQRDFNKAAKISQEGPRIIMDVNLQSVIYELKDDCTWRIDGLVRDSLPIVFHEIRGAEWIESVCLGKRKSATGLMCIEKQYPFIARFYE